MAKKDDIANDLARGRRSIKKPVVNMQEAETVVSRVHQQAPPPKPAAEPTIRTTIDLPKSIHKAIKIATAQNELTLKDYIVSLVKRDLDI